MKKRIKITLGLVGGLGLIGLATGIGLPIAFTNHQTNLHSKPIPLNENQSTATTCQQNNLRYTITNGEAILDGFVQPTTNLIIPKTINVNNVNIPVTQIAPSAFAGMDLQNLILNDNLQVIGTAAFANNNLTTLKLPASLTKIGADAFTNNLFHWGTTITLGENTQWVKTLANSSFGCRNNYSWLNPGIQRIIQGNLVYTQSPNQESWIVTSYLPQIGTKLSTIFQGYGAQKTYHKVDSNGPLPSQAPYHTTTVPSIPIYFPTHSLANNAIWIFNKDYYSGWYTASIGFNLATNHLIWNGINGQLMNPGSSITIQIISGTTGKVTFSTTLQGVNNANSYNNNFKNAIFQIGDYITVQPENLSDQQIYVASNYNATNINGNDLNDYISCGDAWSWHLGEPLMFRITNQGLVNANPITTVNPITALAPGATTATICGTSLANQPVTIQYQNQTFTTKTTNLGTFRTTIPLGKNPSVSNLITVSVPGSLPVTTHLLGANPVNSGITLDLPGGRIAYLSFDGITGTLNLGAYEWSYPSFQDPNLNYTNTNSIGGILGGHSRSKLTLTLTVTTPENKTRTTTIRFNAQTNFSTVTETIDSIPFALGDHLTITSNNKNDISVQMLHSLGGLARFGSLKGTQWSFDVTMSGITSLYAPPSMTSQIDNIQGTFWWTNHDNYLNNNYAGQWSVGNDRDDWYNPNQSFLNVVNGITSAYSTDYAKAFAIMKWVHANMAYNGNNEMYSTMCGWNLLEQLRHLSGQCPTFSGLEAGMCVAAGMVARIVNGSASGMTNLNTSWSNDSGFHAWTQVWCPSVGEWITLDPTYGQWGGNIGDTWQMFRMERNAVEISAVIWPPNTNYFSYFKGYEDEALAGLGQCFYVQQNSLAAIYTPVAAASFLNLFENAMNPKTSGITWEWYAGH